MTFSQFIDYLLWALYVQEGAQGAGQYYDLHELAELLREPVDDQWVFDAGKVLESRGLARAIFTLGGFVSAMLTGEGRLYVEERLNTDGAFMRELAGNPADYVNDSGAEGVENVRHELPSVEEQRAPTLKLLEEMESVVRASELDNDERSDLLADLATVRAQLGKREPNIGALAGVLEPMSGRYPFLSGYVSRLISLLFV